MCDHIVEDWNYGAVLCVIYYGIVTSCLLVSAEKITSMYTMSGKKTQQYFVYNFEKFKYSIVVLAGNHFNPIVLLPLLRTELFVLERLSCVAEVQFN